MGNSARLGVFCLMALSIALSRFVEVELRPQALSVEQQAAVKGEERATKSGPGQPARRASTPAPPKPKPKPKPAVRTYVVQKGDTLGAISKKAYGTTRHWKAILEANRDVIASPKAVRAGKTLKLPKIEPGA